jgi:hypothetical protein
VIPYPASNIQVEYDETAEEYTVKWRPLVSFIGANWQNADDYVLDGADEGAVYGQYAIEAMNSNGTVNNVYYNISSPECNEDGFVTITIPKADAEAYDHWAITAWTDAKGGSISDGTYIDWGVRREFNIN